jgi:hypothetical protein
VQDIITGADKWASISSIRVRLAAKTSAWAGSDK